MARCGKRKRLRYGCAQKTTNQKMELLAIQRVLEFVGLSEHPLLIRSDSMYAIQCITKWHVAWRHQGWRTKSGQKVKNRKLVRKVVRLLAKHEAVRPVVFEWVKGHAGIPDNELADKWAGKARVEQITNWK